VRVDSLCKRRSVFLSGRSTVPGSELDGRDVVISERGSGAGEKIRRAGRVAGKSIPLPERVVTSASGTAGKMGGAHRYKLLAMEAEIIMRSLVSFTTQVWFDIAIDQPRWSNNGIENKDNRKEATYRAETTCVGFKAIVPWDVAMTVELSPSRMVMGAHCFKEPERKYRGSLQ
jgi:hypothetical protein